jgi:cytochrome bd-I ubiquinol oxidase subunit X
MWYFTWVLGLTMAVLLAVINAMWFEVQETNESSQPKKEDQ